MIQILWIVVRARSLNTNWNKHLSKNNSGTITANTFINFILGLVALVRGSMVMSMEGR